nr:uncharacterized protein LOC111419471 [Onthophagus taurus]
MGSPLFGLLADFYVSNLESQLFSLNNHFATKYIKFYCKYVDDILILYDGSDANLIALFNLINNISNLDFTIEKEVNNSINFLDLTISKNMSNSSLNFNIFRKPTTTDTIIPKNSFTSFKYKEAAFRFLFHRAINTPLNTENFNSEIYNIIKIGLNNGYNIKDMQNIFYKVHNNKVISFIYPHYKLPPKYISISHYNPTINQLHHITKTHNIHIATKNNTKISNMLVNNKHKFHFHLLNGVYKISCSECNKIYIGQTGRNLLTRFKEHNKDKNSAIFKHITETKHKISLNNMELIHNQPKSLKLDLLEEYEIYKQSKNNTDNLLNEIIENKYSRLYHKFN